MKKIALIGAGQLGSRHLQALAKLDIKSKIFVVDPSEESLRVAKSRYEEAAVKEKGFHEVIFSRSIESVDDEIDLSVIATSSNVRLKVLDNLLTSKKVEYLILEKVLFQRAEEYETASEKIKVSGAKAWVNCTRRMWDIYKMLYTLVKDVKILYINTYGSDWGLASNAIHILDLISYLSGTEEYRINNIDFSAGIFESKRKGFIEFNGSLNGIFGEDISFSITSFKNGNFPFTVEVITEKGKYIINEGTQKRIQTLIDNDWRYAEDSFRIPYQSELTNAAAKNIFENSECELTTYESSKKIHLNYIKSLNEALGKVKNEEVRECPIT